MANIFKNAGRAIGKGFKDTKNAVVKGARDTVDEGARNLRRPWEAAVLGAVLTPFAGPLAATTSVGGASFLFNSAARHQNLKGALREGGKSTLFAGAGATAATLAAHAPAIWDATSKGGKWAWGGVSGVVGKVGTSLMHGWHPNSGGAGGPDATAPSQQGASGRADDMATPNAPGGGGAAGGPVNYGGGGSGGGGGWAGGGNADVASGTEGGLPAASGFGLNLPTIALGAGVVIALIFALKQ